MTEATNQISGDFKSNRDRTWHVQRRHSDDRHQPISGIKVALLDRDQAGRSSATPWTCRMKRHSARDLAILQALPESATIALFTPAVIPGMLVPPWVTTIPGASTKHQDPFEPLGKAMLAGSRNIKHMPYLPEIRFTDHHEKLLADADAAIVVICEDQYGISKPAQSSMRAQLDFAYSTQDMLDDEEAYPGDKPPLFLLQCGNTKDRLWPDTSSFANVTDCTFYTPQKVQDMVQEIFNPTLDNDDVCQLQHV